MQQTFLVEIGTEELPSKDLRLLAESFAENFKHQLVKVNLTYGEIFWYASPRRLALKVTNLASYQADREIKRRGPAISEAFDLNGKLTKEAEAWMQSCGVNINQIEYLITDKGKWLLYHTTNKGSAAQDLLVDMVINALKQLPVIKLMRWGNKEIEFVRPVRTLIILLGNQLLEGEILGIQSSRVIRGHRFMGDIELIINSAEQYPMILYERGKVIADYEKRKSLIKYQVNKIAEQLGGIVESSDSLLEEITSLVEWPVVLSAKFSERFLSVPSECLVHVMKNNQKCFPIYDRSGKLMPNFIFVVNIDSSDPEKIIAGNEMVIHSRMSDVEFFFKVDCKKSLKEYLPQLKTVLFQKQLGTLHDKISRLKVFAGWIADKIGTNVDYAIRAATLSKCDLMTNMVFEFSNIQGIMGMHYARMDGEVEDVALAIKEHYQPRFAGDQLPSNPVSVALALADKIDTLVGFFGVNLLPKGNKDPFALRRSALGILRIIIEKKYDLDLLILIKKGTQLYGSKLINKNVIDDVIKFIMSRVYIWYREQGYPVDTIKSILTISPTQPIDFDIRLKAVTYFRTLTEAKALIIANKRVVNILHKSKYKLNNSITISLLKTSEEINLMSYLTVLQNKLTPLITNREYYNALIELIPLHKIISDFFDNVIVMDKDLSIRINRLTLLNKLRNLFLQVADISLLQ